MKIKEKIRSVLRENYGNFDTYLERQYETTMVDNLFHGNKQKKEAWSTYYQLVLEIKNSIKDENRVKELQYKLTDDVNHNEVCIEVIEDIKCYSPEIQRLYEKIMNFI